MIQMSHARVRAPQQPSMRRMVVVRVRVMMTGRHDLRSSYACRPGRGARYDIDDEGYGGEVVLRIRHAQKVESLKDDASSLRTKPRDNLIP